MRRKLARIKVTHDLLQVKLKPRRLPPAWPRCKQWAWNRKGSVMKKYTRREFLHLGGLSVVAMLLPANILPQGKILRGAYNGQRLDLSGQVYLAKGTKLSHCRLHIAHGTVIHGQSWLIDRCVINSEDESIFLDQDVSRATIANSFLQFKRVACNDWFFKPCGIFVNFFN